MCYVRTHKFPNIKKKDFPTKMSGCRLFAIEDKFIGQNLKKSHFYKDTAEKDQQNKF